MYIFFMPHYYLLAIPAILCFLLLKSPEESIELAERHWWQWFLGCEGNLFSLYGKNFLLYVLLMLPAQNLDGALGVIYLFFLWLATQFLHFYNLRTTLKRRKLVKFYAIATAVPDIYLTFVLGPPLLVAMAAVKSFSSSQSFLDLLLDPIAMFFW